MRPVRSLPSRAARTARAGAPLVPFLAVLLLAVPAARGQWSSDPAVNLAVAQAASDQILPKIAPTADGGCWIGWFDGIASGFDVRVQRLDADGVAQFPAAGILVADRSFSSVQDWGLAVDASDDAILAFRDDSGVGVQVTAAKVTQAGTLAWGAGGVQLTATTGFVASPKVAGPSDGSVVVTWTQDNDGRVQRLDATGAPTWSPDVVLTPTAGSFSPSDLHAAGTDVLLGYVHQTGGFGSPRLLLAQKLDATGAPLWGANGVSVFDGGSLQFGNYPEFVPDGTGGAVFSWYDTSTFQFQCSVQRVLANGTEAFAHDGVPVSTNATRVRVSPHADWDAATSSIVVFWKEQNSSQSMAGVRGQRVDAAGARQWGSEGVEVVPLGASDIGLVTAYAAGSGGAFTFWSAAPSFGQDRLYGARVDAAGAVDVPVFDVSSTPSGKSRLRAARSTAGFAILAWSDARSDGGDIYAQNVNADGSLGLPAIAAPAGLPGSAALRLAPARPNPTAGATTFSWSGPVGSPAPTLRIVDLAGRTVRTLIPTGASAASGAVVWDGLDAGGRRVAAGTYFVHLAGPGGTATGRVTITR